MTHRLVLSELRIMVEHFTTVEHPDPDFMRSHASALVSVVEDWARDVESRKTDDEGPYRSRLKPCG